MNRVDAFEDFWRVIQTNEEYLKTYGQNQCSDWECRSHNDLVEAYCKIRKYLGPIRRRQLFDSPGNIDRFSAHDHHEALTLVLNPPERWFRQLGMLNSTQYLALKAGARAEEEMVLKQPASDITSLARRSKPRNRAPKQRSGNDLFERRATVLLNLLLQAHGCNSDEPSNTPIEQLEIEQRLIEQKTPLSQSTISRAVNDLMKEVKSYKHLAGMEKYNRLCSSGEICQALNGLQIRSNRFLERSLNSLREITDENIERHPSKGY